MASLILIKLNFFTWNILMLERHFRKTRAKRRDAASTVTKSNIVWTSWKYWLLKNLGPPWQNQEYPHPSSQDSESSCFWHYLKYFCEIIRTRFQANLHATRFSWTYETGIGSIEGDEETEEVADLADWYCNLVEQLARAHRHNQLEELIETEHLGTNSVSTPENLGS